MSRGIITICGISLISDYLPDKQAYTDAQGQQFWRDQDARIIERASSRDDRRYRREKENLKRRLRNLLSTAAGQENLPRIRRYQHTCAELSSLHALDLSSEDEVWLLHSVTPEGELCAEVVQDAVDTGILVTATQRPHLRPIKGLSIAPTLDEQEQRESRDDFQNQGLPNLALQIFESWKEAQTRHEEVILCATGGYKSATPYAVLMAMVWGIKTVFLFEETIYPIEISPPPLSVQAPVMKNYRQAFKALSPFRTKPRKVQAADFWDHTARDKQAIRGSGYVTEHGDKIRLTPLGQLVYLLTFMQPERNSESTEETGE